MEEILLDSDSLDPEADVVHSWRVERLTSLGMSYGLAEAFADLVDWHAVAELVEHGCTPHLALEIVR